MSKSLGNFYTLARSFRQGLQAFRAALCAGHRAVSPPAEFHVGRTAAGRQLRRAPAQFRRPPGAGQISAGHAARTWPRASPKQPTEFDAGLSDDLNTARALGSDLRICPRSQHRHGQRRISARPTSPRRRNSCKPSIEIFAVLENNDAAEAASPGLRRSQAPRPATPKSKNSSPNARPPASAATSPPPIASAKSSINVV